jgi:ribosomal protein S18 acetylase RimI-like enzyme
MNLQIRQPKLNELENTIRVFYLAFKGEFTFIFGKYFEIGKKLFINFHKKIIKKQDLENYLVATINGKIVGAANLDFTNPYLPQLMKFLIYFLKMNLHFIRAFPVLGIRRAIRVTLAMYWFFFENFRRNSCYINMLAVIPEFHNRGIGRKMLRAIEKLTKQKRLTSMTLDVCFWDFPARHLYEKAGFTEVYRFSHSLLKYLNGIEGVFQLKKPLTYPPSPY